MKLIIVSIQGGRNFGNICHARRGCMPVWVRYVRKPVDKDSPSGRRRGRCGGDSGDMYRWGLGVARRSSIGASSAGLVNGTASHFSTRRDAVIDRMTFAFAVGARGTR